MKEDFEEHMRKHGFSRKLYRVEYLKDKHEPAGGPGTPH